ncbi:MAG: TlpA disulfide reductase family protein [Oscillospiraceae bacterium]
MKKTIIYAVALALVLALAFFGYSALKGKYKPEVDLAPPAAQDDKDSLPSESEAEKTKAPDIVLIDTDGNETKLSSLQGKPVVLNFWASWCGPCKGEMPDFQNVYDEYKDKVNFVMLNLTDGSRETVESASALINEMGYTFPIYFDSNGEGAQKYSISGIPTTFIIDSNGNVMGYIQQAIPADVLKDALDELLAQ